MVATTWHSTGVDEVVDALGANSADGLSGAEVRRRREEFGPNVLTRIPARSGWRILLAQLNQPLVLILLGAAAVTSVIGEFVDSAVIAGVVVVNAAIGWVQESKAVRAIEALAHSMTGEATVVRDGVRHVVAATDLVPGDLVVLQAGDRVPADGLLLRARELHADESALTGESVPAAKTAGAVAVETPLADRRCMVHSSTLVTAGVGAALVVATGDDTEIGRINRMIAAADVVATPLTRKIARFSEVLLWVILALAGLTVLIGVLRGEPLLDMFMAAVALAVGAIPEGLPAAMTITLAIGVHRMAKRNAIIRRLPAVETLGSTTVICSDKTGTLTRNEMTVQRVWCEGSRYDFAGSGYDPHGAVLNAGAPLTLPLPDRLRETLVAGVLCNDSRLYEDQGQWCITGDPTEAALLAAAMKAGIHIEEVAAQFPRVETLPFESQYRYMATLHDSPAGPVVYVKGSVERIVAACDDTWLAPGRHVDCDRDRVLRDAEEMAADGLRVLAFARARLPDSRRDITHDDVRSGLSFLGLQGMLDPPREQSAASVAACRGAGIGVKMITGDHRVTAAAVAAQVGLGGSGSQPAVISGQEMEAMDDVELESAGSSLVFARVAPEQKLRLVRSLQAAGHVVAMTGDGVNDAPALKQADIGVAMGRGGTEVAKEAADMVLTDDDFSTIAAAVEEGRAVFDNLVKFITWTLPTNVGEGLVIFTAVLAGVTLPITPVQILWINMTTAVLLGLMLAFERKEPGIMQRPPRTPAEPVLTGELVARIIMVGVLLLVAAYGLFRMQLAWGVPLAEARTVAANMFVVGELFYLFNCRSLRLPAWRLGLLSNPLLLAGAAAMIVLQLLFTYTPPMQAVFGTAALDAWQWAMVVAAGSVIYTVVEVEKRIRRHASQRRPAG